MGFHSKVVRGTVSHHRLAPSAHRFTYPFTFFIFDIDELAKLDRHSLCFAHNHFSILSLHDRNYLQRTDQDLEAQLAHYLSPKGANERTLLVTSPQYFGYAFNPVNFHLRMDGTQLKSAVVEVNNTFGDTHIYPLDTLEVGPDETTWLARCPKAFHVSPFNDRNGEYRFTFRITAESIFLGVDLYRENECVMQTYQKGELRELTTANLLKYALLHPLDTAINSMPRILWQAALLYYKRKLDIYPRPKPDSVQTLVDRDHPEPQRPVI